MLSQSVIFSPENDDAFFQELPAAPAVFLLRAQKSEQPQPGAQPEAYVSRTANLRRRLQRLLSTPSQLSKRLNLRNLVREVEFTPTGSDFESQFLLYQVTRELFPKTYSSRLRLRPAPMIKLHLENEYPRASVTTRLGKLPNSDDEEENLYYGPFPSRAAAEKFANDSLDFFKMRRCVDDLHPDPSFPGCVYSEMKMCLAPCFKGCTDDEYRVEVGRVRAFLDSGGESLSRELALERDHASDALAFEEAAAIHAKTEKLKPVLAQLPEIVQRIDRLQAIIVQPAAQAATVMLFHFANGLLCGPIPFRIEQSGEPQSLESRLQGAMTTFPLAEGGSTSERVEQLAIVKRWYYRSHRVGEIFFADAKGVWPMRRMVRGIGRVYRGEKAVEPAVFSATPAESSSS